MIARCINTGLVLAGLLSPAAIAQAAPTVDASALSAADYPVGSTGYERHRADSFTESRWGDPGARCGAAMQRFNVGRQNNPFVETSADRDAQSYRVSVISRPVSALGIEKDRACFSDVRDVRVPADLSRYRPAVLEIRPQSFAGGTALRGFADVRERTVEVEVRPRNGSGPADAGAFWQLMRAQIAKVERQP